ncbi:MAG: TRAP transporter small permease subunit [Martelella sp.]|uniref:TRAP transporter small permease n=1 Tax=Martelella sp. TaxID=1969699 RepID=UPI0032423197
MIVYVSKFLDRISDLFVALICAGIAVMTVINGFNIIWRAVFDSEPGPILPWTVAIFIWTVFLGFFPMVHEGRDVSLEYLRERVSAPALLAMDVVTDLIMLIVALLIFSQVGKIISMQVGTVPLVGFERYWLSVPLFVSCGFIALEVALRLLKRFSNRETV